MQHRLWPICGLKPTPQNVGVSTEIQEEFAKRLRYLRLKKGWTQVQMAERLGIDRSYLSDMERGKKNVCLPTLKLIAEGFGISLSKLLTRL